MKSIRVTIAFLAISLKRLLEVRANTIGNILNATFSLAVLLLFIQIVFSFTPNIVGWTKEEAFFFVGIFRIIRSTFGLLNHRSITDLPNLINKGDLDIILTKPISSQLYISFRTIQTTELINVFIAILLCIFTFNQMGQSIEIGRWIIFLISLIAGYIVLYSLYTLLATMTFWAGKFDTLPEFFEMAKQPLSYPIEMLGRNTATFFTYIIPLAFITTIPVSLLFSKVPTFMFFILLIVASILLYLSKKFWNRALLNYSSASS